jgi:hypothetical protein
MLACPYQKRLSALQLGPGTPIICILRTVYANTITRLRPATCYWQQTDTNSSTTSDQSEVPAGGTGFRVRWRDLR